MSYPRRLLGCQCELFVVCVYVICLICGHRLPCCRLYYLTLSKPIQAHQKYIATCVFASRILGLSIYFWWTCRGSNPGPECLHFEGITTILYMKICTKTNITIKIATMNSYVFILLAFFKYPASCRFNRTRVMSFKLCHITCFVLYELLALLLLFVF